MNPIKKEGENPVQNRKTQQLMVLMIVVIGLGLVIVLNNYLNQKRERRQAEARERREQMYLNLLESLKKKEEK